MNGGDTRTRPEVGVILCDCRGSLRPRLDFASIETALRTMDSVAGVAVCPDLCAPAECLNAMRSGAAAGATRLVIGGCAAPGLAPVVRDAARAAGVKDGLWGFVNIAEQCARVHGNAARATAKAAERLAAAVGRVMRAEPIASAPMPVRTDVVVVGGGVAGLQAALALEALGHGVALVHSGTRLGGNAAAMPEAYAYVGDDSEAAVEDVRRVVARLAAETQRRPGITVHAGARLKTAEGEIGNFRLTVTGAGGDRTLEAGAIVLATGGALDPIADAPFRRGSPRAVGLHALLQEMRSGTVPRRIALVMDLAGEQGRAVSAQVLSVAERLAVRFGARVKVYCRHVRVAATGLERLYRRAREAGVVFVKSDEPPLCKDESQGVLVRAFDAVAGAPLVETFDVVAMADVSPVDEARKEGPTVPGLRPGAEGAAQYDDVWLLPALTNRVGVYAVGGARGPSEYREAMADGLAAAAEIHGHLNGGRIEVCGDAAAVDSDACVLCLTCVRICPHGAISVDAAKGAASVSALSCRRCGVCAAECPAHAITLPRFTDEQMAAELGHAPRTTVFACENSAIPAADAAAGREYDDGVGLVRVPCAGKVSPRQVLTALEQGAERVVILGCHPESCRYLTGSTRGERRMRRLADTLGRAGVDPSRVMFGGIASVEPGRFVEYVSVQEKAG